MKTRSIVSAIVAAALSVVLCVGLLVGTTVAWFTDTVSSTGNSITAGALAVELNDGSSEALFTSAPSGRPALRSADLSGSKTSARSPSVTATPRPIM